MFNKLFSNTFWFSGVAPHFNGRPRLYRKEPKDVTIEHDFGATAKRFLFGSFANPDVRC